MSDAFDPELWVISDCKIKECDVGVIHFVDRGYDTVARCPLCDRARMPSLPRYKGAVSQYTKAEMEQRLAERTEILEAGATRKGIAKAIMFAGADAATGEKK